MMVEKVLVHNVHGLCKIIDTINMNSQDFAKVLILDDSNLIIYCPLLKLDNFFREPIAKKDIPALFDYMKTLVPDHIDGSKKQREFITNLLYSGNIKNIAYLYVALEKHKDEKAKHKQTLSVVEQRTLKSATNALTNELSYVLNVPKEEIENKLKETTNND